jgi:heat-inducible transcriptional repressor
MSTDASNTLPNERGRHLLTALIQRYIRDGQPVGSRTLSKDSGLELSPATIRNVMSDLEDMGLVAAPHTSAGRVPTPRGYRMFVDTLVRYRQPGSNEIERIRRKLRGEFDTPSSLLGTVSNMLSEFTSMAGVVTVPRAPKVMLRQIEFLPLSDKRILVILVVNDTDVQNRILHNKAEHPDSEYLLAGETNLMDFAELSDIEKLRKLFEAFSKKRLILDLLDRSISADGVRVFIGEESGYQILDDCSIVTAPYHVDDETIGVLGVIGPTRMAYDRVVPIVDVTARLLESALGQGEQG